MGEEEKKQEEKMAEENNIPEEAKKPEEVKAQKPSEEKVEEKKAEESKDDAVKESKGQTPPPPPQEIILRVYMHCEGCARKVGRCLKGFQGVEDVQTDFKTHKVVVKGEKADPLKVLERVQKKSHRQVELLSPIPKPPSPGEPKKPEEKEAPKSEEKKEELQEITVVLKVHMHCEACAQEIKKRIQRMKGVEKAEPDLKASQVTVKGVFDPPKLVEYVYKRTGKQAVIVDVEPENKEEDKRKDGKEEKKAEKEGREKNEGTGGEDAGGEAAAAAPPPPVKAEAEQEEPKMEMQRNEFYYLFPQNYQVYHPQTLAQEMHAYPPQIFSDENPNACSII